MQPIFEEFDRVICNGPSGGLLSGTKVRFLVGTEQTQEIAEVSLHIEKAQESPRRSGNYEFTGKAFLRPIGWANVTGFFSPTLQAGMMKKVV